MFEHLQLFKDIAHFKSISRAAAVNGVSQSAASQHVQELEREFQVPLLDRTTRPLTLTPAGVLYQELCREVLRKRERFEAALARLKQRVEGTVRVASIYSVGLSEMSRLELEFARRFPDAELLVEYLRPEKIYQAVLEERADLGLVSYAHPTKDIAASAWRTEEMVLAVPPGHPLAGRSTVSRADLAGQDFVTFDEDLPIRRELDRFLRDAGVEPAVVMHFDNIQMIKEAVALGSGVSILPARAMSAEISQGRLKAIPLEQPGLVRPLGIIHLKRKNLNRASLEFLELCREFRE